MSDSEQAAGEQDIDVLVELGQQLIHAILEGESLEQIKRLTDVGAPVWYQTEDEGISSLHAAAYTEREDIVELLIAGGAVWNAVDFFQNTAADIALSLNNETIYTNIRNAGIRAELLLTILASRTLSLPDSLFFRESDSTATGSTDAFLSSPLRFVKGIDGQDICMLDSGNHEIGVMMGWETPIMERTVRELCQGHKKIDEGLNILNVGFGLGIIDGFFQSLSTPPSRHVIIEPHRDVLDRMRELGWYQKKGVMILEGRWQDFVSSEQLIGHGRFDVVYTDTFSEHYKDLHQFFRYVPNLLVDCDSKFSFFNGLGATNALFHDVYTHLSELHLRESGMSVSWCDIDIDQDEDVWNQTRKYFSLPIYRLPIVVIAEY